MLVFLDCVFFILNARANSMFSGFLFAFGVEHNHLCMQQTAQLFQVSCRSNCSLMNLFQSQTPLAHVLVLRLSKPPPVPPVPPVNDVTMENSQ